MDPFELFRQIGWYPFLTLVVETTPLMVGGAYAIRPSEVRLALIRPFSLAALFAGAAGTLSGFVTVFSGLAASGDPRWGAVYAGVSEALVPAVFGLTCLTLAWLLVAVGMWRGIRDA